MSQRVEFYAGAQPHFCNHLAPIWQALPVNNRGGFHVRMGTEAERRARELSITPVRVRPFRANEIVIVAGFEDYRITRPAKVIFYNHGVGQTYFGDKKSAGMSSYSGGRGRERTILFLCPSERDAEINRAAYPNTPAVAIGVPYLDNIIAKKSGPVAISFHANIQACPETRWAWPHFNDAISDIAQSSELGILGHCHPRARRLLEPWWKRIGVWYEPDLGKVLEQASCYVIDNSSSGYETAALGIPTVWMNAPWYRKDVHHGLRFWDAIPGIEVDHPGDLLSAIKLALTDPPELVQKREAAIHVAYSGLNGHATERAIEAICRLINDSSPSPRLFSIT